MALTSDQITAQNFADFYNTIKPYLNGGGVGLKLLWENSDPTSAFAAQDITLSSSDYDFLLVIYNWSTTSDDNLSNVSVKGHKIAINLATNNSSNVARNYERYGTPTDATHISFTDCTYTGGITDNRNAIPYRIYGIKVYNRDVPAKTTLLWSNPDPSSSFTEQDVSLANSDYDLLTVVYAWNAGSFTLSVTAKKDQSFLLSVGLPSASGARTCSREVTFLSNVKLHFYGGRDAVGTTAASDNNNRCVPLFIYGIKL